MDKDKGIKLSLCMIVKDVEGIIPFLWTSVKDIVDEWIVVDTGSSDNSVSVIKEIGGDKVKVFEEGDRFLEDVSDEGEGLLKKYGVNDYPKKIFNFGEARNFSFEQATGDFILWLDADDVVYGAEKLRYIIDNNLEIGGCKGLHLLYKYEVDEDGNVVVEHWRERVVPNNSNYRWVGKIHEIIIPKQETKYFQVRESDSHVLHTSKDKFKSNKRNIVSLAQELGAQGKNRDPRTIFQLAEAFNVGYKKSNDSIELYKEYLGLSSWDEERALVCQRLCDIYLRLGEKNEALEWAYKAVKERPDFPGNYATLAQVYYAIGEFENAINFAERSLELEQPPTNTFVNQKHNRVTPLLILSYCNMQKGVFDEAIKLAKMGKDIDENNENFQSVIDTCQRQILEERITRNIVEVGEYLVGEGEIVKANSLKDIVPLSHQDDPRMKKLEDNIVVELNKRIREKSSGVKFKEDANAVQFVFKELESRKAESIFLLASDECNEFEKLLNHKGYKIKTKIKDGDKFDAVILYDELPRLYKPDLVIDMMVGATKSTGVCIAIGANRTVEDKRMVNLYDANSVGDLLFSKGLEPVNCLNFSERFYASFLPGKTNRKKTFAFVCGNSVEKWGPLSVYDGIGGSEEAVCYLSEELNKLGHKVIVYGNIDDQFIYNGVVWKHHSNLSDEEIGTAIYWRSPALIETHKVNADNHVLWLHDVPQHHWFTEAKVEMFDKILVLSEYHKTLLPEYVSDDKVMISSNGVKQEQFVDIDVKRDPYRCIYTSSYDRGLENLLMIWGDIKKEEPKATLHIYYGWGNFEKTRVSTLDTEWRNKMMKLMKQDGVYEHGRISQPELAIEMKKSGVFSYPCHFEEISCISAMKAQLAGCFPLTSDYAALAETNLSNFKVSGDMKDPIIRNKYKRELLGCLSDVATENDRYKLFVKPALKFSWGSVAKQWSEKLGEKIK